jgi:hypothetical protein
MLGYLLQFWLIACMLVFSWTMKPVHSAEVVEIDRAILERLNAGGRLGTHALAIGGGTGIPRVKHIPRVADRIVELNVNVISIDSISPVLFERVGARSGSEEYFSFLNCGNSAQKRKCKSTISNERTTEIEFTRQIKTSTYFKGKTNFSGEYFWGKVGREFEGGVSREVSFTDRNKSVSVEKTVKDEEFEFEAPRRTKVIYRAFASTGHTKKIKFSGTVLVEGIYHYVIGKIWDQNANIEAVLKEDERKFPFEGFLGTINLSRIGLERFETPLTQAFCNQRAKGADDLGGSCSA